MASLAKAAVLLSVQSAVSWPWDFQDQFDSCYTDVNITGLQAMSRKGFTVDDVTLRYCPSRIPERWPNTHAPVATLRLFRTWQEGWPEERREDVWQNVIRYIKSNRVKVLMATPISCSVEQDDQDWSWTRDMLRELGPDHVMGFAVGNELDLLYTHATDDEACLLDLWDNGRLWSQFTRRVAEIDEMGFGQVPVTSVFTAGILYGGNKWAPFVNVPGKALVNDFLLNATRKYSYRYTFTFNIYPYFDPSLKIDPPRHTCASALKIATCFGSGCLVARALGRARGLMKELTGRGDDRLWIGEIGWSSPKADALGTEMAGCPEFSSLGALTLFYENFLQWDLSTPDVRDPDHVFYFTLRDALNFGNQEHFGVIQSCQSVECKIRTANYTAPLVLRGHRLPTMRFAFFAVGLTMLLVSVCGAASRARSSKISETDTTGEDSDDSSVSG